MADPLRRTLSKLRGRRSQRGAAAGAHPRGGTGAPQGKAQQQPPARAAPCAQPRSREVSAPPGAGSQEESGQWQPGWSRRGKAPRGPAALGEGTSGAPAPPGCTPGDPSPQPVSAPARRAPDGEEGDYYDNETLPWGCRPAEAREEAQGLPAACARGRGEGRLAGPRESTGRLQSQLQEAYYLLIHAMHDLPPASPACAGGFPQPVASCGAAESSDAWSSSSGEGSPQQQVSATAWLPPPGQGSAGRPGQLVPPGRGAQSLGSLLLLPPGRPAKPPPLQRCLSDSVIRYHPVEPALGHLLQGEPPGPAWDQGLPDGCRGGSDAPAAAECSVSCGESRSAGSRQAERLLLSAQGSAPQEAAAGGGLPAACPCSRPHVPQSSFRPPAVSVGKLQKWVCKGRLLSLGMKGRVGAGASSADPRAIGTGASLPAQPDLEEERPATPPAWRGHGSKALTAPPDQRVLLTDLIENIYISSTSGRELKILMAGEVPEHNPQLDSITVSKKRNWLHQSTLKAPNLEEENICKKMQGNTIHVPKSSSPLPGPKLPPVPPKSPIGQECPTRTSSFVTAVHHSTNPSVLRNCTLDFSEDNDADDEGEIWYNPIPEDDEPDFPRVHCFTGKNSVNLDPHTTSFKMLPGSDLIKVMGHNKGLPYFSESAGDNQMAQACEINQADSIHSTEYVQLHKQSFVCKTQSATAIEESPAFKYCSAGVLKDYLRELPSPLITKQLYETVLDAMVKNPLKMTASGCENDPSDSEHTVALLDCLPDVEKATLKMLLDHLKLVASYHEVNKMTCQNLAVCFGPVLLSQRQETSNHNNRVFTDSEELASALDFKKHIEVLHYLLQLWPVQCSTAKESTYSNMFPGNQSSLNYLRPKKQRPQMLNLSSTEMSGVLRPRPARLDSPSSNRYAGDWSSCGENYFLNPKETLNEADYDDVPSEDTESGEDCSKVDGPDRLIEHAKSMSKEHTFQTYLTMQTIDSAVDHRVNLKDLQESIDTLIGNLERELNKNKLNITY
ncbi:rho GTPase-activating protein SYDE2 isoform X3 [Chrysemys picta bellii]|uniref:rho GTPase-activating protein SYDE2 isoform X3 n=1 Tax=Chrysemys picta bellii TaxID=8478 RepID=UPI0032B1EFDD